MLEVLWSAGAFIVAVGFLVAFHEWGHFWVARKMGVEVLRFSIGFGPVLASRRGRDGTEYALSAIPLGGYVKMLDEREAEVPPERLDRAFNRKSVGKRIAIVVAGPAANFLFAIVAYWCMFVLGQDGIRPILGEVEAGTRAAQAGLRAGDEILRFDDRRIRAWDQLRPAILDAALDGAQVPLLVRRDGTELDVRLNLAGVDIDPQQVFGQVGLDLPRVRYAPILGAIVAGESAERAGLESGDRILSLNGEEMRSWDALRLWVREHPGEIVRVRYRRDGQTLELEMALGMQDDQGVTIGRFGAGVAAQPELWQDLRVHWSLTPWAALPAAVTQTVEMSQLTLQMLGRMVTGEVSVRNISGPIHIAQYAGTTAAVGMIAFLSFLAIISISLGVLNLLPIPVLDGGHLLFYLIEWLKGSPLSERAQLIGQQFGMAALLMLMSVAFYNDIVRLVG